VLLGQSRDVFVRRGYGQVENWRPVTAPGRRRKWFYDGDETLAAYIASVSDIDDLIPILTALEIEWNKLHDLIRRSPARDMLEQHHADNTPLSPDEAEALAGYLLISPNDLGRLWTIWRDRLVENLWTIGQRHKHLALNLLAGSLMDYWRATQKWWDNIAECCAHLHLEQRPIYFVSGNTHSLVNLLSGFAQGHEDELVGYVATIDQEDLRREYQDIEAQEVPSSRDNFLYYVLKKYLGEDRRGAADHGPRDDHELVRGIHRIPSAHYFDVDAQIVELRRLIPSDMDERVRTQLPALARLADSDALILNIDYPLGMAAYNLLTIVAQNVGELRGVYVMGKAASLNGRIGDVLIPNVVYEEHSQNTYLFDNCFQARDVAPFLVYGSALDNQKSVSVRGTFLQNKDFMDVFYSEGYTDIEMEAGPYLSAVYEMVRAKRYPINEIITLYHTSLDVGFLHYVSDTPYSKGKNLGAHNLSYYGMDPTYASAIAILRRILSQECAA
ncbi:MAG: hypothetical protein KJ734_07415, partial [Chloroflexi bacterium]|nr:hypothetical protein [Chloroflexota bacterium]